MRRTLFLLNILVLHLVLLFEFSHVRVIAVVAADGVKMKRRNGIAPLLLLLLLLLLTQERGGVGELIGGRWGVKLLMRLPIGGRR